MIVGIPGPYRISCVFVMIWLRVLHLSVLPQHCTDDSALFCICASQYLEFEGKSFCTLLYTHYRACSTYVWHGLVWNPSVTGGKSAKLLILLYQSQYLSADDKIF